MSQPIATPTVSLPGHISMPMVGFGTWQLRGREAYESTRFALEVGYRHLDTATTYGNEAEVGRAIGDSGVPRDELFVTTKLPPRNAGRERETLEASLGALNLDWVDLWLVHWPPHGSATPETWREFQVMRDEGRARAIGVSNYDTGQIDELTRSTGEVPAVNQVPWSPTEHSSATLEAHRARGVVVEGYSPLRRTDLHERILAEIASGHGVSPAQVVLRWHLAHGIVVIPKSGTPVRIRENFDLFGFELSDDEVALIDSLSAGR